VRSVAACAVNTSSSAARVTRLRLGGARLAQVLNSLHTAHGQQELLPPQDTAKQ
jgi:hypothetical protein